MAKSITIINMAERDEFKREHHAGAINIPFEELGMRAPSELVPGRLSIVDCTGVVDAMCSLALERISRLGFDSAAVDFSLSRQPW